MPTQLTDAQFSAAEGVADWRVLFWGAKAHFATLDFAQGVRFLDSIAEIADELGHNPQVDLRTDSVTVQVLTIGEGLTEVDLELARRISFVAAELGLTADPSKVQHVQLAVDVADQNAVMAFWQAALGYVRVGPADILQPDLIGPPIWFQDKAHVPPRNRIHVDVSVPHDVALERVDRILAAGGRLLGSNPPEYWSLIDPEGNVVDVATWQGRG